MPGSEVNKEYFMNRIAIQGGPGAFHEIAARNYFPETGLEIIPALTFPDLIETVANPTLSEGGIMAIENSIAGSILGNYRLLNASPLTISGEVFLRIRHNLMALPGTDISEIREVHSHPVAIAQCHEFFKQYPHVQLKESADTALSAKNIQDKRLKGVAAIASAAAADLYEMDVLAKGIEDNKQNFTRFLILHRERQNNKFTNKVSVSFSLLHRRGSLAVVLTQLAVTGANLTKIQSVPLLGKEWQYVFFIDFVQEGNGEEDTLKALGNMTTNLKVLGLYQSGVYYES
ncbi:MAG: prephenate dehydratase [Polaribacter sp.]|jgi:prephenate dehydratase